MCDCNIYNVTNDSFSYNYLGRLLWYVATATQTHVNPSPQQHPLQDRLK